MYAEDIFQFSYRAAIANRGRTLLMLLAMAIGVASVVLLISLGESARKYVTDQFASLGSNLLIVLPGRTETVGGPPPLLGTTPRDLTIEDALALNRSPAVKKVSPIIIGAAPISWQQREREILVIGSTSDIFSMRHLSTSQGRILPVTDPGRGTAVCVIGHNISRELFGTASPIGKKVRLGEHRFRIIGVLEKKGQSLGDDLGNTVVIPIASAQTLFNTSSLFRVLVEARSEKTIPRAKEAILSIIKKRHDGEDDITVITQDAVLSTFDRIFRVLTYAVAGIAAISLVVAGILVMNVMLVAVSSRRAEIGLLKALGSPRYQIQRIFLAEAALLSLAGALLGLVIGIGMVKLMARLFPQYPIYLASWSPVLAIVVSLATGIIFGVLPARQAASLAAADALSRR
jgi:putative ABC transport system permease protein